MIDSTLEVILEDVKSLISYSVTHNDLDKPNFERLHKAIVKRYFEARNVKINYTEQTIDINLPISKNRYTPITFECLDLSSFLQSCLKKDENSLNFYQNLLSRYDVIIAA